MLPCSYTKKEREVFVISLSKFLETKRGLFSLFMCLSFISILILYLFNDSIFLGGDMLFHKARIEGLALAFKNYDFFPKINYTFLNGLGYASSTFYSDIFFIIPALLLVIGFTTSQSYIAFIFLLTFATFYIAYYSRVIIDPNSVNNKRNSIVFSIFYTLAATRLIDVYLHGAIGQTLAFVFYPLVLSGIYNILYKDESKWHLLTIGMSCLLLSHVISTLLMVILVASLVILNGKNLIKENKRFISLFKATLTTIPLVLFYLVPLIEQFSYQDLYAMNNPLFKLSENTVSIKDIVLYTLFTHPYGATIGILSATYLLVYLKNWKKISKSSKHLVSISLFCWLGTTNLFYWGLLDNTFLNNIQFPWRLFSVATLLISWFMSIDDLGLLDNKLIRRSTLTLSILTLITFEIIMRVSTPFFTKNEEFNDVSNSFIGVGQEYLPLTTSNDKLKDLKNEPIYNVNSGFITKYSKDYDTITFNYNFKEETLVTLPFINYKGYYINESGTVKIKESDSVPGLISLNLKGEGEIKLEYKGTIIQHLTLGLSILAWLNLALYLLKMKLKLGGLYVKKK